MKQHQDMESLLIEYIDGQLSTTKRAEVELQLEQSAEWRKVHRELKNLLTTFEQVPEEQPPITLQQNFHTLLEKEQQQLKAQRPTTVVSLFSKQIWQVAAAVALLVIGLGFGFLWQKNQQQQQTIATLQQEMKTTQKLLILNMLKQPSASERIKAVNISTAEGQGDVRILEALIHTLESDENTNVRMKAAEALAHYGEHPKVVSSLINVLREAANPEIQIAAIEALVHLQATTAIPQLQRLIKDESVMKIVQEQAALGLETLL